MNSFDFSDLCELTCEALGLPNTTVLGDEGEIELDGVRIGVFLDENDDSVIHCFTDLGEVPQEARCAALEDVLQLNLELDGGHGEAVGLDKENGRLVLRSAIPSTYEAGDLAARFKEYAAFAKSYRPVDRSDPALAMSALVSHA